MMSKQGLICLSTMCLLLAIPQLGFCDGDDPAIPERGMNLGGYENNTPAASYDTGTYYDRNLEKWVNPANEAYWQQQEAEDAAAAQRAYQEGMAEVGAYEARDRAVEVINALIKAYTGY